MKNVQMIYTLSSAKYLNTNKILIISVREAISPRKIPFYFEIKYYSLK